jgi:hypothetical protein
MMDNFLKDLTEDLKNSSDKSVAHLKNQYYIKLTKMMIDSFFYQYFLIDKPYLIGYIKG